MAESTRRLHHLLEDKLGACREEDVKRRLDEIHHLATEVFTDDAIRQPFSVLGNDTRYRLARALSAANEELCVCELEPLVGVSESAVSHALSDLVEANLATRRKDGNWRYYRSTPLADSLFETAANHSHTDE